MKVYLWLCAIYFSIGFLVCVKDRTQTAVQKFVNSGIIFALLFGALYQLWD